MSGSERTGRAESGWGSRQSRTEPSAGRGQAIAVKRSGARSWAGAEEDCGDVLSEEEPQTRAVALNGITAKLGHMPKSVLWIDDSTDERAEGNVILRQIGGIIPISAASSQEAERVLATTHVDAVITDILRRHKDGSIGQDDGYSFFREYIRPRFPTLPVLFHTKNLPSTFQIDDHSEYLSKWDARGMKVNELEVRLADKLLLYDAHADLAAWNRIEPRLIQLNSELLGKLEALEDVWTLAPDQFEQLVGEVLIKNGYSVLWVPGGKDGGIDIVAASKERDFLIDVKRYKASRPVTVELVRAVYGVAESVAITRPERILHGGIITSSRFTKDAQEFKKTLRRRPLLHDFEWLSDQLAQFAPKLRK